MFKKILIANRGEIAVRIIATCREMGIRTVAVYSDVDCHAHHVRVADEAYAIGPAPAAQSYLQGKAILAVARQCGAEAIHPGYGFLSENADFAEACEKAGVVFIGPPAAAMRLMGSKIAAKQLAQSIGAPTVPGYNGASQDDEALLRAARRIGFPLLIKASAGGGGKGMREVHQAEAFLEQLAGARREARASFGDETVFLERLILRPRHVEIQILADRYGQTIHLGERECSIQRRHQKIIEESPSIALTPSLRAEMGAAAVGIARAAGYVNAGTLEFMLDEDQRFYFLEMNTRLQVEHPVTELVTGLDLVRHQLLIAAGEPLTLTQEQISQRGHAIEARLYAEDPDLHFLPAPGLVSRFVKPEGPGIRLDSGINSGDEITQYYDPMIAKLIVYGENRSAAITRLQQALVQCAILGVTTNIPLLHAISLHPSFAAGQTYTSFLDEHPLATTAQTLPEEVLIAAALTTLKQSSYRTAPQQQQGTQNPWQFLGQWRTIGDARTFTYQWREQTSTIALSPAIKDPERWHVHIANQSAGDVILILEHDGLLLFRRGTEQIRAYAHQQNGAVQVIYAGHTYHMQRQMPPDVATTAQGSDQIQTHKALSAPMAGTIVKIQVKSGQEVQAQQTLVILSAMKMEHTITAPYAGKVLRIHYQEGAVVKGGAIVIEME